MDHDELSDAYALGIHLQRRRTPLIVAYRPTNNRRAACVLPAIVYVGSAQVVYQLWVRLSAPIASDVRSWTCSDLGLLKRDKALQQRYEEWSVHVKEKYGSNGGYQALVRHRLLYLTLGQSIT